MTNPTPAAGQRYELVRARSAHKGIVIELTERIQRVDGPAWSYVTVSAPRHLAKPPGSVTDALLAATDRVWRFVPPANELDGKATTMQNVEAHRFSFEGSTTMLADHLVNEHGLPPDAVSHLRGGLTQGHWVALDDLHKEAHRVPLSGPTIVFSTVQQATSQTKKLCRAENITIRRAQSRYMPKGAGFQTVITLPDGTSDAQYSKLTAVLYDAGYKEISMNSHARTVSAVSRNATYEGESTPVAEIARRALVERLPDSFSADEVSAMSDDEAISMAVGAGVLEG